MLLWGISVIISHWLQDSILTELHHDHPGLSHLDEVYVAKSHVWWPGLDKDLEQLDGSCKACHTLKQCPPITPCPWIWSTTPWVNYNLNPRGLLLAGPTSLLWMPIPNGQRYFRCHLLLLNKLLQ